MGEPTAAEVTALKTTSRTGGADDNFYASADGRLVPVSSVGEGRLRYNNATKCWQSSVDGGPYNCLLSGAAPNGGYYVSAPAATPIPVLNTPVKILGTTTAKVLQDFTHSNNRLTYIGTNTKQFTVLVSASIISNISAHKVRLFIAKNGAVIADSAQDEYIQNGPDTEAISLKTIVSLATNEFIEVWAETNITNAALTVTASLLWVVVFSAAGSAGITVVPLYVILGSNTTVGFTQTGAAFAIARRFRYRGKNVEGIHNTMWVLAQRNSGGNAGTVRIVDQTSGLLIASVTGITAATPTFYSAPVTVANLPATAAHWTVEAAGGGGSTVNVFNVILEP